VGRRDDASGTAAHWPRARRGIAIGAAVALQAAVPARSIVSASVPYPTIGSVERLDSALDALLAPEARMEKLAEGFRWSEGPVWRAKEADLIFSDVPANIAYRWSEGAGCAVFVQPSGDTGAVAGSSGEGSNGLTLDEQGRLLLCQHGDRRLSRLASDGHSFEMIVERYDGKRFNSPNDLCLDRAGNLFFTDPPYGLGKGVNEQGFSGVYRRATDGSVTLLHRDLDRPNGLALSPDEKILYVANSGEKHTFLTAFDLRADGTVGPGRVLFDASALLAAGRPGLMDGLKVDVCGNIWATGPGGVIILSSEGKHLGTLLTGTSTANCCFGGADGATLHITANNMLLRIATRTKGCGF
jgi:gluconolactonase